VGETAHDLSLTWLSRPMGWYDGWSYRAERLQWSMGCECCQVVGSWVQSLGVRYGYGQSVSRSCSPFSLTKPAAFPELKSLDIWYPSSAWSLLGHPLPHHGRGAASQVARGRAGRDRRGGHQEWRRAEEDVVGGSFDGWMDHVSRRVLSPGGTSPRRGGRSTDSPATSACGHRFAHSVYVGSFFPLPFTSKVVQSSLIGFCFSSPSGRTRRAQRLRPPTHLRLSARISAGSTLSRPSSASPLNLNLVRSS
jgi:hypothetical protein